MDLAAHRWCDDQSPFGQEATGPNPTDRGKCGTTRSVLTEGRGLPIAIVVAGAIRKDRQLLADTLEAVVIDRPQPTAQQPQHLCVDKGYDYPECHRVAEEHGYQPHLRARGEEQRAKREHPTYKPRRWVVEVCHSWLNRFRQNLVRFEKLEANHLGLLQLACAYIVLKRAGRI